MARLTAPAVLTSTLLSLTFFLGNAQAEELIYRKSPELSGKLCIPEGPGPFPVVVYNHGGEGYSKKRGGQSIGGDPSATCAALAKAGFVGFSPIRRPSAKWNVHVQDIMAAIDAVKKVGAVDPDKIGMIGFSVGGLVSLLTAMHLPRLRALVIMAGAANAKIRETTMNLSLLRAPVLMLVAENDTGSRYTRGVNIVAGLRSLHAELKEKGKESTLIVYPPFAGDGHSMFFGVGDYWNDVVPFLKRHF